MLVFRKILHSIKWSIRYCGSTKVCAIPVIPYALFHLTFKYSNGLKLSIKKINMILFLYSH